MTLDEAIDIDASEQTHASLVCLIRTGLQYLKDEMIAESTFSDIMSKAEGRRPVVVR